MGLPLALRWATNDLLTPGFTPTWLWSTGLVDGLAPAPRTATSYVPTGSWNVASWVKVTPAATRSPFTYTSTGRSGMPWTTESDPVFLGWLSALAGRAARPSTAPSAARNTSSLRMVW